MRKLEFGMTAHQFASVINENAAELGTAKTLEFETMTPNYLAATFNEQLEAVSSEEVITYESGEVVEIYNEEVGDAEPHQIDIEINLLDTIEVGTDYPLDESLINFMTPFQDYTDEELEAYEGYARVTQGNLTTTGPITLAPDINDEEQRIGVVLRFANSNNTVKFNLYRMDDADNGVILNTIGLNTIYYSCIEIINQVQGSLDLYRDIDDPEAEHANISAYDIDLLNNIIADALANGQRNVSLFTGAGDDIVGFMTATDATHARFVVDRENGGSFDIQLITGEPYIVRCTNIIGNLEPPLNLAYYPIEVEDESCGAISNDTHIDFSYSFTTEDDSYYEFSLFRDTMTVGQLMNMSTILLDNRATNYSVLRDYIEDDYSTVRNCTFEFNEETQSAKVTLLSIVD